MLSTAIARTGPRVRTSIAIVSAVLAGMVVVNAILLAEARWLQYTLAYVIARQIERAFGLHLRGVWSFLFWVCAQGMVIAPALLTTAFFYHWLTYRVGPHGWARETRCRRCFHILRSLSEPRCPECGEVI